MLANAARNPKITEIAPYEPRKIDCLRPFKSTHSCCACKGIRCKCCSRKLTKQIVDAGIADEFGLITAEWAENEFDALQENYPVVSVIRLAK